MGAKYASHKNRPCQVGIVVSTFSTEVRLEYSVWWQLARKVLDWTLCLIDGVQKAVLPYLVIPVKW
jgi:hypothetical protein